MAICKAYQGKWREPGHALHMACVGFSLLSLLFLMRGLSAPIYIKLYALAAMSAVFMMGIGDASYLTGRKNCAGWVFSQNHAAPLGEFVRLSRYFEVGFGICGLVALFAMRLPKFAAAMTIMFANTFECANIFMNARCFYKSLTDDGAIIPAELVDNPPRFDKPLDSGCDRDEALYFSAAASDALIGECEGVLKNAWPSRFSCANAIVRGVFIVNTISLMRLEVMRSKGISNAAWQFLLAIMALMMFFGVYGFLTSYIICLWNVVRKNIEPHLRWARPGTLPSGMTLAKEMRAFSALMLAIVTGCNLAFLYFMEF